MSEQSKAARAAMKDKARRLTTANPHEKVDASSWAPPEPLNTEGKTGLRPVSPRAFKAGGKVEGERGAHHAGRKPRKDAERINRDVKAANAELGKPHVGGFRRGGRADGGEVNPVPKTALNLDGRTITAGRKAGGRVHSDAAEDRKLIHETVKRDAIKPGKSRGGEANYEGGTRPTGGRMARKSGGRTKGKTNIVIAINPGGAQQPPQQQMQPPAGPPPRPPMPAAPPVAAPPPMPMGMPPSAPPMGMPPGGMMPRKSGGRAMRSYKDMDAGSLGGMGRLEKTEIQKAKRV